MFTPNFIRLYMRTLYAHEERMSTEKTFHLSYISLIPLFCPTIPHADKISMHNNFNIEINTFYVYNFG